MRRLKLSLLKAPTKRLVSTTSGSVNDEIRSSLVSIKGTFPNRYDLHARIDTALSDSPKSRIAIIPFKTHRIHIKGVLDVVLSDPLATDQSWYQALRSRLLSKDALVKYAPEYTHQGTTNSLAEYPIPFNIPPNAAQPEAEKYEFVEINSWKDSKQHVLGCQLHVFVSKDNAQAVLTSRLPSEYPSILVVDEETLSGANLGSNVIALSSDLALQANELLSESPSNASQYTTLIARSNISALEGRIFQDADTLRFSLFESIARTCETCVTPSENRNFSELKQLTEQETKNTESLRQEWAKDAHVELQGHLTSSLDTLLYSTLAWWKLYYKVDDVYDLSTRTIQTEFLPHAKASLDYLVGRIDSYADKNYQMGDGELKSPISDEISVASVHELVEQQVPKLHNDALKALSITVFGIQLPSLIIPLLGWYFFDYSMFSMGSIIALGTVLGLRNLQKSWLKSAELFKAVVLERARTALSKCEAGVWQRWEAKVIKQQDLVKERKELVVKLKDLLKQ